MTTARNAPCPCGSGNKFKRCCGAEGSAAAEGEDTQEVFQTPQDRRALMIPLMLVAAAIGIGIGVGTLRGGIADGLAVSFALILGVMIFLMARNPPEGTGRGGGAAINYGMGGKKRGSAGPQNRRQRRRK